MRLLYRLSFIIALVLLTAYDHAPLNGDPTLLRGCVPVGEHMSMYATEVTVRDYGEFIISHQYDSSLYPADSALPDQYYRLVFKSIKGERSMRDLMIHLGWKAFATGRGESHSPYNSPVVGISYQQAVSYCEWLEATTNSNRPMYKWVRVGLPSIEVYQQVIENTDSLAHHHQPNPCYMPTFNYRPDHCIDPRMDMQAKGFTLLRADAYWPSRLGIYCLQGNAAEMTSIKGIAMGGSFRHYAYQSHSDQHQSYTGPQDWLGFRYVVTPQADNP
jgi:Sulfatase-modifying factor enzyme 1